MASNKLPDTLKERIADEAEAAFIHELDANKRSWAKSGYLAAASKILSDPGAYGLAGAVTDERRKRLREEAITALELLKGYTPEQRANWGRGLQTVEEFAGYIMELASAPSDRVKELEQALKSIERQRLRSLAIISNEFNKNHVRDLLALIEEICSTATNALKK